MSSGSSEPGEHDYGNNGERWIGSNVTEQMESVAIRHFQVSNDVGRELEIYSIAVFAFSFNEGNGVIAAFQ